MKRSRAPRPLCPVCRTLGCEPKATICSRCQALFDDGSKYRALRESKKRVVLGVPAKPSDLRMCHINHAAEKRLNNAFIEVIHAFGIVNDDRVWEHFRQLFPTSYVLNKSASFEKHVPDLLRNLWEAIEAAIVDATQNGKDDGTSLLVGLATGETSIDDFNKATIGKVRKQIKRR